MGLTADQERVAGESLCAVAGRRFCAFPERPTQLQNTQHNCRSQDAKKNNFSEMSAHRKLLLRIRCGHFPEALSVTRTASTVEILF